MNSADIIEVVLTLISSLSDVILMAHITTSILTIDAAA